MINGITMTAAAAAAAGAAGGTTHPLPPYTPEVARASASQRTTLKYTSI